MNNIELNNLFVDNIHILFDSVPKISLQEKTTYICDPVTHEENDVNEHFLKIRYIENGSEFFKITLSIQYNSKVTISIHSDWDIYFNIVGVRKELDMDEPLSKEQITLLSLKVKKIYDNTLALLHSYKNYCIDIDKSKSINLTEFLKNNMTVEYRALKIKKMGNGK